MLIPSIAYHIRRDKLRDLEESLMIVSPNVINHVPKSVLDYLILLFNTVSLKQSNSGNMNMQIVKDGPSNFVITTNLEVNRNDWATFYSYNLLYKGQGCGTFTGLIIANVGRILGVSVQDTFKLLVDNLDPSLSESRDAYKIYLSIVKMEERNAWQTLFLSVYIYENLVRFDLHRVGLPQDIIRKSEFSAYSYSSLYPEWYERYAKDEKYQKFLDDLPRILANLSTSSRFHLYLGAIDELRTAEREKGLSSECSDLLTSRINLSTVQGLYLEEMQGIPREVIRILRVYVAGELEKDITISLDTFKENQTYFYKVRDKLSSPLGGLLRTMSKVFTS